MVTSRIHSFQFCYWSWIQGKRLYLFLSSPVIIIHILDLGRLYTYIRWWPRYLANKRPHPTWTSVRKSRRIWRLRYPSRHVGPLFFYFCIRLHAVYPDMPIVIMTTLSQELSVLWVTARLNTTTETMAMTKPLAHVLYALFSKHLLTNNSTVPRKKANFRRTNVATKLKLTYVKDNFLDVSAYIYLPYLIRAYPWSVRSKFSTKLVSVDCL